MFYTRFRRSCNVCATIVGGTLLILVIKVVGCEFSLYVKSSSDVLNFVTPVDNRVLHFVEKKFTLLLSFFSSNNTV